MIQRFASFVCLAAILASTAFASPNCQLCAPSSAQHHALQPVKVGHDHCGAVRADASEAPSLSASTCGHSGSFCMSSAQREHPVAQLVSATQSSFSLAEVSQVSIQQSGFPPPNQRAPISPTPLLLTANLRV